MVRIVPPPSPACKMPSRRAPFSASPLISLCCTPSASTPPFKPAILIPTSWMSIPSLNPHHPSNYQTRYCSRQHSMIQHLVGPPPLRGPALGEYPPISHYKIPGNFSVHGVW